LVAVVAIALAALGSRTIAAAAGPGRRDEPAALIVIRDAPSEFMPKTVPVPVGDTVEWRNTSGIAHSVEFVGEILSVGRASSRSGVMAPGKSYSFTFKSSAAYAYVCRFHVINGMIGNIVVVPDQPDPGTTTGTR
jgi:plastocyanin